MPTHWKSHVQLRTQAKLQELLSHLQGQSAAWIGNQSSKSCSDLFRNVASTKTCSKIKPNGNNYSGGGGGGDGGVGVVGGGGDSHSDCGGGCYGSINCDCEKGHTDCKSKSKCENTLERGNTNDSSCKTRMNNSCKIQPCAHDCGNFAEGDGINYGELSWAKPLILLVFLYCQMHCKV